MSWCDVGSMHEYPRGVLKRVDCAGRSVCIARTELGQLYAFDDACTHEGYSLSEQGEMLGDEIESLIHGSTFNMITGSVTGPPASEPMRTYAVVIGQTDGRILVQVGDEAQG
jgi:3-phenylpropionate/trans-cinnamate dioxygenase ferredoxin component